MKMKLSKSKMLMYIDCPRKFKLRYVNNLPYPATTAMSSGTDIHAILERFFDHITNVKNPEVEYMQILELISKMKWVDDWGKKYDGDKFERFKPALENFAKFEIRRRKMYEKFLDFYPPMRREKTIQTEEYNSIIDRIDYYPQKGLIVTDYKTGDFYPAQWEKARFELTFYAYMISKKFNRPVWKIAIIPLKTLTQKFLNSDKIYPYEEELTKEHYDEMFRVVKWIEKEIEEENFAPKEGYYCYNCPYNNLCDSLKNKEQKKDLLDGWEVDNK